LNPADSQGVEHLVHLRENPGFETESGTNKTDIAGTIRLPETLGDRQGRKEMTTCSATS